MNICLVLSLPFVIPNKYSSAWLKWLWRFSFISLALGFSMLFLYVDLSINRIDNVLFIITFSQPILILIVRLLSTKKLNKVAGTSVDGSAKKTESKE